MQLTWTWSFARSVLSALSLFHACPRTGIPSHMMWLQITRYHFKRLSPYVFHLANNLMWMSNAKWCIFYTDVIYPCEKLEECFRTKLCGLYSRPHTVWQYPSVFSTILFCSAVIRKLFRGMWKWKYGDQWRAYGAGFLMIDFFFFNSK